MSQLSDSADVFCSPDESSVSSAKELVKSIDTVLDKHSNTSREVKRSVKSDVQSLLDIIIRQNDRIHVLKGESSVNQAFVSQQKDTSDIIMSELKSIKALIGNKSYAGVLKSDLSSFFKPKVRPG